MGRTGARVSTHVAYKRAAGTVRSIMAGSNQVATAVMAITNPDTEPRRVSDKRVVRGRMSLNVLLPLRS